MTASEARMLEDIGVLGAKDAYDIYRTALHDAENVFDGAGSTDGHSDAFRHAYWNAMLANRFGQDWAAEYATAHERVPDNPASSQSMDLHNNEVGRQIAAAHPDAGPEELAELIEQAVYDGDLIVVETDGRLTHSDNVEIGQSGTADDLPHVGGPDPGDPSYGENTSGGYNPGGDGENYGTYGN
ncbi:DUF6973 domain-containing protein [Actinoalloteichus hymeniacidonis]|nr:hypothetical protein [Actinoalloteichus hymeniacidonis]MBB5907764.1 hypothetical protein [Actinoalloteichus hymeniacidonis]